MSHWKTLEHIGPYIFPRYEGTQKIKIYYKGKLIKEEINYDIIESLISFYKDKGVKDDVYMTNFISDFFTVAGQAWEEKYPNFLDYDLSNIDLFLQNLKKPDMKELEEKYGYCMLDGKKEKLRTFHVDEPAIFRGSGDHRNRGRIKKRIYSEDVTINSSIKEKSFSAPNYGRKWKEVKKKVNREFVASWFNNITNKVIYIYLARNSDKEQDKEKAKFDHSLTLSDNIDIIRKEYTKMIKDRDQIGLILYLVDNFSLRIGNEATEKQKASTTYGITTLLSSFVTLEKNDEITLSFIGKDSIEYLKTHKVDKEVYKFLKELKDKVKDNERIFEVDSGDINNYLKTKNKKLTAKNFRTRNASLLMYNLVKETNFTDLKVSKKIEMFTKLCIKVAELCNHKRLSKPTASEKKLEEKMQELIIEFSKEKDKEKKSEIKNKIEVIKEKISFIEDKRDVALTTSKINYIDPRIIYKWLSKDADRDVMLSKIYSKKALDQFKWAEKDIKDNPNWEYY